MGSIQNQFSAMPAGEEHFAKAGVVHRRGIEAAAGGAEGGAVGVGCESWAGAGEFFGGDVEGGVVDAERGEDALAGEVGKGLAGECFDEVALDVDGDDVGPAGAERGEEGNFGQAVDHGLEGGVRVDAFLVAD